MCEEGGDVLCSRTPFSWSQSQVISRTPALSHTSPFTPLWPTESLPPGAPHRAVCELDIQNISVSVK